MDLKLSTIERQLEECIKAKDTYSNFMYSNLNAIEIASYALSAILNIVEAIKDTWEKGMDSLKANFDDFMKMISAQGSKIDNFLQHNFLREIFFFGHSNLCH